MIRKTLVVLFSVSLLAAIAFAGGGVDLHHNILPKLAISPDVSVSNNDNTDGSIIDRLGYGSVTFVIVTGTLADADATLTPEIHECVAVDNCTTPTVATSLIGTVAGATFAATDDNTVKSIGYGGGARFVRLRITPANNTGAAKFGATCILGNKQYGPAQ